MGLEDRFSFFMDMTKYHLTLVFHFIHSTHFMSSTTLNFYQPSSSMPEGFKTQWGHNYVFGVGYMSLLMETGLIFLSKLCMTSPHVHKRADAPGVKQVLIKKQFIFLFVFVLYQRDNSWCNNFEQRTFRILVAILVTFLKTIYEKFFRELLGNLQAVFKHLSSSCSHENVKSVIHCADYGTKRGQSCLDLSSPNQSLGTPRNFRIYL